MELAIVGVTTVRRNFTLGGESLNIKVNTFVSLNVKQTNYQF